MGVLAGSRHFDGATPVKVEVAQLVSEFLEDIFVQVRVVIGYKEMSGQDTSLSCSLAD